MTVKVLIQNMTVPLATLKGANGQPVSIFISNEWRRPLELMAKLVNEQQAAIDALTARIDALEGV